MAIKYGLLTAYAILAGILVVAICYFLKINPVYSSTVTLVQSLHINSALSNLGSIVKNNWATIGAFAVPGVLALITYIGKKQAMDKLAKMQEEKAVAEKSLTDAQQNIISTKQSAQDQINALQAKIDNLNNDDMLTEAQRVASEKSNQILDLQAQLKASQDQINSLNNLLANSKKTVVEKVIA